MFDASKWVVAFSVVGLQNTLTAVFAFAIINSITLISYLQYVPRI